ncbi:MAG: hypothetical protein OER80_13640 [Gammaproteobacteria bacterium]|nr:hypothetical protein [Gammaproteobacteria bacterium]MDH3767135.1 hypothetical protein [Gammaproteobacteria bacterium]
MKYFLDLSGFNHSQLADLLALARRLETEPDPQALAGRIVTLLLMDRSFHTVSSFQAAMSRLGGECIVLDPEDGLETESDTPMTQKKHHAHEVLHALGNYSDVIGIRAHGPCNDLAIDLREDLFRQFAAACPTPLINLGSAIHHPCQGLADLKTLEDLSLPDRGGRFVLSWVYDTEAKPLAAAVTALQIAAMRGMRVSILAPEGYALPQPVVEKARNTAAETGGSVIETDEPSVATDGAHVIYGASWACTSHYGNAEKDTELRKHLSEWCVDELWFEKSQETCRYMQTLPLRREVSVTADVLEGPRSAVVRQAGNRVPIQMAILHRMILPRA